jgi:hypothetical protein
VSIYAEATKEDRSTGIGCWPHVNSVNRVMISDTLCLSQLAVKQVCKEVLHEKDDSFEVFYARNYSKAPFTGGTKHYSLKKLSSMNAVSLANPCTLRQDFKLQYTTPCYQSPPNNASPFDTHARLRPSHKERATTWRCMRRRCRGRHFMLAFANYGPS